MTAATARTVAVTLALVLSAIAFVLSTWQFSVVIQQQKRIDRVEKIVRIRCSGGHIEDACAEFSIPIRPIFRQE